MRRARDDPESMDDFFRFFPLVATGVLVPAGCGVPTVPGVSRGVPTVGVEGTVGALALGAVRVDMTRMRARRTIVSPMTAPAARSRPRRTLG
jgi:hypothetical protein